MASAPQSIMAKFGKMSADIRNNATKARAWFRAAAKAVTGRSVNANEILRDYKVNLLPQSKIYAQDFGRIFMFYYDPKLKDVLPYYDRFPLCIPISKRPDGFIGLNLHYLPWVLRAKFMDALYSLYQDKYLDPRKKLRLTYAILKNSTKYRWFKPCIKRYLYGHIRSKFFKVPEEQWDMFLMLPTEKFEKRSKTYVWKESEKQLGLQRYGNRHLKGIR